MFSNKISNRMILNFKVVKSLNLVARDLVMLLKVFSMYIQRKEGVGKCNSGEIPEKGRRIFLNVYLSITGPLSLIQYRDPSL